MNTMPILSQKKYIYNNIQNLQLLVNLIFYYTFTLTQIRENYIMPTTLSLMQAQKKTNVH